MNQFPQNIKFKYPWRTYQQRVLDELDEHLEDNHLHVIAPPGSGKTILGLEVSIRLNKPTLIFAPTVAIRNQWIQRFCELFLQVDEMPDWISRDIKNPKFITVSTYQGLHSACSAQAIEIDKDTDDPEEKDGEETSEVLTVNELIRRLKTQGVGTIVVDEAHHLKNAWWESLTKLKKALNPTIVGLTATPPYDVSMNEWERYIELNGPVDAEISVPELVVEGDLCPHQDYVFVSQPSQEELNKIDHHRKRIEDLVEEVKSDETLRKALSEHPIFKDPTFNLDWIYSNLEYYSATLIFLKAIGQQISFEHLEVIGDKNFKIPALSKEWLEILLTFYLYKDPVYFEPYIEHQEKLINKLKRNGAMNRRSVNLHQNKNVDSSLTSSLSKLESIDQIVNFEHQNLKDDLRMVVLTDYIRKEFLVNDYKNTLDLNKIGVMPIFEKLRRTNNQRMKLGVLTGSLVIIPETAHWYFKEAAAKFGIDKVNVTPLPFDSKFIIINSSDGLKHDIVRIVTDIFEAGHIQVLVGTKSLLGEGWDAPSINSLILASFVGSYVLSNQMRGRAIRTERTNKQKSSNIWHLICVDPSAIDGGKDYQLLKRRFRSFVGVSFRNELSIENGIARIKLPDDLNDQETIQSINTRMFEHAGNRAGLKAKWNEALAGGVSLIEEIKVPYARKEDFELEKSMWYDKTIKRLFALLGSGILIFLFYALHSLADLAPLFKNGLNVYVALMFIGIVGFAIFGRLAFKAFRMYVKYRDISKDIEQIGQSLLASLIRIGVVYTSPDKMKVEARVDKHGAIFCHLEGGTTYEKSSFITALHEIIGPVSNPRYLIIRKNKLMKFIAQRDYHSVPELIGKKKLHAIYFEDQWENFVGNCELVYTRTIEGRKLLLKSRINSLASEFEDNTERINQWR